MASSELDHGIVKVSKSRFWINTCDTLVYKDALIKQDDWLAVYLQDKTVGEQRWGRWNKWHCKWCTTPIQWTGDGILVALEKLVQVASGLAHATANKMTDTLLKVEIRQQVMWPVSYYHQILTLYSTSFQITWSLSAGCSLTLEVARDSCQHIVFPLFGIPHLEPAMDLLSTNLQYLGCFFFHF